MQKEEEKKFIENDDIESVLNNKQQDSVLNHREMSIQTDNNRETREISIQTDPNPQNQIISNLNDQLYISTALLLLSNIINQNLQHRSILATTHISHLNAQLNAIRNEQRESVTISKKKLTLVSGIVLSLIFIYQYYNEINPSDINKQLSSLNIDDLNNSDIIKISEKITELSEIINAKLKNNDDIKIIKINQKKDSDILNIEKFIKQKSKNNNKNNLNMGNRRILQGKPKNNLRSKGGVHSGKI